MIAEIKLSCKSKKCLNFAKNKYKKRYKSTTILAQAKQMKKWYR